MFIDVYRLIIMLIISVLFSKNECYLLKYSLFFRSIIIISKMRRRNPSRKASKRNAGDLVDHAVNDGKFFCLLIISYMLFSSGKKSYAK